MRSKKPNMTLPACSMRQLAIVLGCVAVTAEVTLAPPVTGSNNLVAQKPYRQVHALCIGAKGKDS